MEIREIKGDKKRYLELLLLADEQESMVDRYLQRGTLYVLWEDGPLGVCVVTDEGNGILEIKNLAVSPAWQRKGYGRCMIQWIEKKYGGAFKWLRVGTGESPLTMDFYRSCGFLESGRVKDFFTENYDHPIFEGGVQLRDMVYFEKSIS